MTNAGFNATALETDISSRDSINAPIVKGRNTDRLRCW